MSYINAKQIFLCNTGLMAEMKRNNVTRTIGDYITFADSSAETEILKLKPLTLAL
jgi:hypothetical protein